MLRLLRIKFCSLIFIVLLGGSFSHVVAQQDPMYTMYMFNKFVYNPACAGLNREYIDITLLYHNQWVGFQKSSQGTLGASNTDYVGKAPQTETFSFDAPIPNTAFGAGLYVIDDVEGFNYLTSINLAVSYKKDLQIGTLQFGINGGAVQAGCNGKWLVPDPNTPNPIIPNGDVNGFGPDLGIGAYLFTTRYFAGISAQHLLAPKFNWVQQYAGSYQYNRTYYATAGYNFLLPNNPDYLIEPSSLIKLDPGRMQLEFNTTALYRNKFWGGISWKQGDTWSALIGLMLTPNLKFGYSYDYTGNQMSKTNSGTHEVMVNYIFKIGIKKTVKPTIIIWSPRFL